MKRDFLIFSFFIYISSLYSFPLTFPDLNYKTLESKHFYIHFPENSIELATEILFKMETLHSELSSLYRDNQRKTHIVIIIRQDITNAITSVYGLDVIIFYLTPPIAGEFSNYKNWIDQLIWHEYTHILVMRNYQGFWNYLFRFFFGVPPNASFPDGILEGISVIEESRENSEGRLWDANTNSILRQQLLYNRVPTLEEIFGGSYRWPLGDIPYLYGARYLQTILQQESKEQFLAIFSSTTPPIFLRKKFKNQNLKDPEKYYNDFINNEYNFLKKWTEKKLENPITPYEQLTHNGGQKKYLKTNEDQIYYFEKSSYRYSGIYQINQKLIYRTPFVYDFSIDKNSLMTSEIQILGNFQNAKLYKNGEELFFSLMNPGEIVSMRFPILSKNTLYYIETKNEIPRLIKANLEKNFLHSKEILFEGNFLDVINDPLLIDNSVYFIYKKQGSITHFIIECNLLNQVCKKILELPCTIATLHNFLNKEILFSSDLDGNFEIYSLDLSTKKVYQLTNSLLSMKYPVFFESYLYGIGETYQGNEIFRISKENLLYKEIHNSTVEHLESPPIPQKGETINETLMPLKISNYNLKYFQFFLDGIFTNTNFEYALQISGIDPLKRHRLQFGIGKFDTYTFYYFDYDYSRFIPSLQINYTKTNPLQQNQDCYPFFNSFIRRYVCKTFYEFEASSLSFSYPYNFRILRSLYTLGISNKEHKNLNLNSSYVSDYTNLKQNSIFFRIQFSYFDVYYLSISPENGFIFNFRLEYFPFFWNSISVNQNSKISYDYLNLSNRIELFLPWFLKNHVPYLSMFLNYNLGKDRDIIQYRLSNYQKGLLIQKAPYGKGNIVLTFEYRLPLLYSSKRILWFLPEVGIHWISLAPFYEIGKSFDRYINERKLILHSRGIRSDWKVYMFYLPFYINLIYAKGTEEQYSFGFSLFVNFDMQTLQQKLLSEFLPATWYYK